jgi:hypothetical protein
MWPGGHPTDNLCKPTFRISHNDLAIFHYRINKLVHDFVDGVTVASDIVSTIGKQYLANSVDHTTSHYIRSHTHK